jgi:hypothetical protein
MEEMEAHKVTCRRPETVRTSVEEDIWMQRGEVA